MKKFLLCLLCIPLLCCACAKTYTVIQKTEEAPIAGTDIKVEDAPVFSAEPKIEEPAAEAPALPVLCELGSGASIAVFENGEKKGEAALTRQEDGECVDLLYSGHILQSAAWPGSDPSTLKNYTLLSFDFAEARHNCYIYQLPDGRTAFQDGAEGMYTIVGEKCLPALNALKGGVG